MKHFLVILSVLLSSTSYAQIRKVQADGIMLYADKELTQYRPIELYVDSIMVTHYKKDIWFTYYKGDTLYMHEFDLKEIVAEKQKLATQKAIIDSVSKKKYLIKKYGLKMGVFISNGYIKRGMTKEQARFSWGEPDSIHRLSFSGGMHEQWVYGKNYLYFENGILTAWQD